MTEVRLSVCCRKHFRAVDAIDIVPRVPPLRKPPRFPGLLTWFERNVLGRHIVGYCHSGEARQGDKIVQASGPKRNTECKRALKTSDMEHVFMISILCCAVRP